MVIPHKTAILHVDNGTPKKVNFFQKRTCFFSFCTLFPKRTSDSYVIQLRSITTRGISTTAHTQTIAVTLLFTLRSSK